MNKYRVFHTLIPKRLISFAGYCLLFLFSIFPFFNLYSQDIHESVHYINYSINDGLPSAETYDVFQDSKGYLWIGTDNGVVRYDGSTFEVFTTKDGLTDNTIFKIQEDYQGRIWFMTYNRRLCYFQNGEIIPYEFNDAFVEATKHIYVGNTVTKFEIDTLNNIKIVILSGGTNQPYLEFNISSKGDVSRINSNSWTDIIYQFKNAQTIDEFWKLSNKHLNSYSPSEKLIIQSDNFGRVHLFNMDQLVAMGNLEGLYFRNKSKPTITKHILNKYAISGLCFDFEGGLWCSTLKNGIIYIPNIQINLIRSSEIGMSKGIQGIIPQNKKLFLYSKRYATTYQLDSSMYNVNGLNQEVNLNYVGHNYLEKGINFQNPIFFKGLDKAIISAVFIDSSHTILVSSTIGLMTLKVDNNVIKQLKTFRNIPKILKLIKDSHNNIWIGTLTGLYKYNPKTEMPEKSNIPYDFANNRIQDIVEVHDSTIFFATKTNGLYLWKNNHIKNLTTADGLIGNTINQLVFDSVANELWVSTNKGICKLYLDSNNKWVPIWIVTLYDGLETVDIRQIIIYNNHLVFSNATGLSTIPLNKITIKNISPFFYFKSLLVNDLPLDTNNRIELLFNRNNIKINYQGISFRSLSDLKYKYKLSPINESWITTKSTALSFNTLPPGDYTFTIKAINVDGIESEVQTIRFEIIPAIWMTIWFKIIAILVAIGFGYWISIKSIKNFKSKAELQRNLNELQAVSLQSKMNPHFIFNSLNSIQNYILKNEKENASEYLIEFSKLIRVILDNSNSPTISLTKELETLRMYVGLEKKRLRQKFEYLEDIDSNIDIQNCMIPTLLIQPYIENSIWHGKVYDEKNGFIQLKVRKENELLHFEIIDNGIGIKKAESSKIITSHNSVASSITKKRVTLLGLLNNDLSEVIITEAFEKNNEHHNVGTRVSFTIPYTLKKSV